MYMGLKKWPYKNNILVLVPEELFGCPGKFHKPNQDCKAQSLVFPFPGLPVSIFSTFVQQT